MMMRLIVRIRLMPCIPNNNIMKIILIIINDINEHNIIKSVINNDN